MIVKKTYTQLFGINSIGGIYTKKNDDNKISEALKKFCEKQLKKHFEEYNDKLDDLRINNCLTDCKNGAIIRDERGNRMFSVAGEIKLKSDIKKLNNETVEIHSRIVEDIDDLITQLNENEKEAFSGIIIPAVYQTND